MAGLKRLHNEFFYKHYKQEYEYFRDKNIAKSNYEEFLNCICLLGSRIHVYQDVIKNSKESNIIAPVIIQRAFLTGEEANPVELQLKQAGFSNKATRIGWSYTGKVS